MAKDIRVVLDERSAQLVEALVSEGRYGSPGDVLRAGLQLLLEHEAAQKRLSEAVREGLESGPGAAFDVEAFLAQRKAGS